ncbi:MAG: hypothetical protein HYT46_00990 [Candidatus Vogelbacteria bacterium]|nr:hypothetical protein [Candidatus Vogelbacteria bacterium]
MGIKYLLILICVLAPLAMIGIGSAVKETMKKKPFLACLAGAGFCFLVFVVGFVFLLRSP